MASRISARVGLRMGCQQRLARQHHAGDAEAALHGAVVDEGLLQVVRAAVGATDAFDGGHLPPARLRGQHQAGVDQPPVQQHGAGAALADAAAFLGAGQVQVVTQERSAS